MQQIKTRDSTFQPYVSELNIDLLKKFVSFIDAKPKTIETYGRALKQFFYWLSVNNIRQPQRHDILIYRDFLNTRCKPSTVQNYISTVRLFFRWISSNGLYLNVAEHVKGAKLDKNHKKDYLTSNQIKTILSFIDKSSLQGKRDYAIFTLMTTGGLRAVEVVRANYTDLKIVGDCEVLFIQGKGRDEKTEYVKIQPQVSQALRDYINQLEYIPVNSNPLFISFSNRSKGDRLTVRSVSRIIKNRLLNAGLNSTRLTSHSLRHSAVTLALLNGATLQEVQQFARHSSITTTQIYAHNLDRANNTCEATIAHAIFDC
jgi:integrase/recombinase XerC